MITVEDFNSVLKEYGGSNIYHCIDTSNIQSYHDFSNVKYDFCEVSRSTSGNNITYTFKVVNDAWTGRYWITDNNDNWLDVTGSYNSSTGVITIVTKKPSIKLYLYISNIAYQFYFERVDWKWYKSTYTYGLFNSGLKEPVYVEVLNPTIEWRDLRKTFYPNSSGAFQLTRTQVQDNIYKLTASQQQGMDNYFRITNNAHQDLYAEVRNVFAPHPLKSSVNELCVGKINHIGFAHSGGSNWGKNPIIYYNNKKITLAKISDGFDIDLTDKKDLKSVSFKVKVNPVKINQRGLFNGWTYDFRLPVSYLEISTVSDLVSECGVDGAGIFELGADLTLTDDLTISHDVKILGEDCTIDLDGNSVIVSDGVKFELSDCSLINGDNAIVQKADTEVELTGVTFTNCESTEYSNLGSCIYCDIDLDSLDNEDDFKTTLTECEFYNNQSAILHGGNLIIDSCKLHNTDLDYLDKHNVALLYQTDGNATIRNSILDIDYTDTDLCTNQESIGFAQCLFQCGTSARINNTSYNDLRDNGIELTSNATHIFAKYYYPTLEECVFTSPVLDREDKSFCYSLTGLNKIFKHNVQITKASDNAENTYRKIQW